MLALKIGGRKEPTKQKNNSSQKPKKIIFRVEKWRSVT
jgi:hypothetical protein